MELTIKHSVGQSGVNDPPDVKIVQQLLNFYLAKNKALQLAVDGKVTGKMVAAIVDFQVKAAGFAVGNGQMQPGGNSFKALVQLFGAQMPPTPAPTAPQAKPNKTATAAGKATAAALPKR